MTEVTPVVEVLARDDVEGKKFLKRAGRNIGAAAAASGLAAFIAACGSSSTTNTGASTPAAGTTSSSPAGSGDLAIVNYALTLEYLEAEFYGKVTASGLFSGSTLSTLKNFGAEENAHVKALESVAKSLGTP